MILIIKYKPLTLDKQQEKVPIHLTEDIREFSGCPLSYPADTSDLDEDICVYSMPDGTYIDVGFYPDYKTIGRYRVIHFGHSVGDGSFDDGTVLIETQDIDEVARAIEKFALAFSEECND